MPQESEAKVRARAGLIGFAGELAETPVGELSGGERTRLLIGLATFSGPHLLILDEPTNHLDIDSRSALIAALNAYRGAVVLVSHDRHLVEACADRLWLVADGQVTPFDGDLDDYRARILADDETPANEKRRKQGSAPRTARAEARRAAVEKRVALAPLRRRIADAEAAVERLNSEIATIDATLAEPGFFARAPERAAALAKARAERIQSLARAEQDWFEATAAIESKAASQ